MPGTVSWTSIKAGYTSGQTISKAIRSDGSCCRMDISRTTGHSPSS